jgi:hypothetical protein
MPMSMSKSERKRRAHAERNRKYRDRQKSREAALKAAQAQQWALQRQKQQELWSAQEKALQEAEAARKAAEPKPTCVIDGCQEPSCENPKARKLCTVHHDLLFPPTALDLDGAPEVTKAQVREYNRRRVESENPYVIRPIAAVPRQASLLGAILGPPAVVRYSEFTEAAGMVEIPTAAEKAAQDARTRELRANRTWTDDQLVQFHIDVREQMNRRNDVEAE